MPKPKTVEEVLDMLDRVGDDVRDLVPTPLRTAAVLEDRVVEHGLAWEAMVGQVVDPVAILGADGRIHVPMHYPRMSSQQVIEMLATLPVDTLPVAIDDAVEVIEDVHGALDSAFAGKDSCEVDLDELASMPDRLHNLELRLGSARAMLEEEEE